jgi:UPF0755 protein
MARIGIAVLLVVLLVGAAGSWLVFSPYAGFGQSTLVEIPRGTGTRQIAELLVQARVIRSTLPFLVVRALRSRAKLQAGEYEFSHPDTPWHVFQRLAAGDVHYYELVVPEGSNLFDISNALDRLGLMKNGEFIATARRAELVKELLADMAPAAPSLEGFLFPSTYRLTRQTTPEKLAREMVQQFRKVYSGMNGPTPALPVVTLASLVEKESAVPADRPVVASVYTNRAAKGMKLDCDPTTIYAAMLDGHWRGAIYRSDLDSPNPYNTYRNPGLPPGPIANPGREALQAAIHPAETKFFYFVAKPDGSGQHVFSEGLAEHAAAVAQYRRGQKNASTGAGAAVSGRAPVRHN